VVGYGAVAFYPEGESRVVTQPSTVELKTTKPDGADPRPAPGEAERRELLRWARATLARYMQTETAPLARTLPPVWQRKQGVFVTLTRDGQLRGCMGVVSADLPVGQAVGRMTLWAAYHDERFEPVRPAELDEIEIEISLLGPLSLAPEPGAIVLGRDGIRLEKQGVHAVYLPKVPVEQGWDLETTLGRLCLKAGLPADCWQTEARLYTFQAEVFGEHRSEPSR
jgi:AmmeMemoRadiSam system protein A